MRRADHAINVWPRSTNRIPRDAPSTTSGCNTGWLPQQGGITKEQFLDLNEHIGGFDVDGRMVQTRTVGDPVAIRAAYRSGRLTSGAGGLGTTPIIDLRAYLDDVPQGNIHLRYHSFSMRERLLKANGHADNHVMLTEDRKWGDSLRSPVMREALSQMDRWLTRLSQDTSNDPPLVKLRRARPADLVDACWTRDDQPRKIVEKATYGAGRCEALYPANSFPRGVAGAPLASDIIKCQLEPIEPSDYKVRFTAGERTLEEHVSGWRPDCRGPVWNNSHCGTWQTFGPTRGDASPRGSAHHKSADVETSINGHAPEVEMPNQVSRDTTPTT